MEATNENELVLDATSSDGLGSSLDFLFESDRKFAKRMAFNGQLAPHTPRPSDQQVAEELTRIRAKRHFKARMRGYRRAK